MQVMREPKKKQGQNKQQVTITGNGKFLKIRAIKQEKKIQRKEK